MIYYELEHNQEMIEIKVVLAEEGAEKKPEENKSNGKKRLKITSSLEPENKKNPLQL